MLKFSILFQLFSIEVSMQNLINKANTIKHEQIKPSTLKSTARNDNFIYNGVISSSSCDFRINWILPLQLL